MANNDDMGQIIMGQKIEENQKLYKKDYEKVLSLASSALSSTTVPTIQAESYLLLARVHHARDDIEQARTNYERAVQLNPELVPARFGLAQTLIWDEDMGKARGELEEVLKVCPRGVDAYAALGLLEVSSCNNGENRKIGDKKKSGNNGGSVADGLTHLRKAIDLDPGNPDLVLLEALALQQRESDYPASLEKYRRAVELMEGGSRKEDVSWEILTNMGVLCHETKKYEEAGDYYERALEALDQDLEGGGGKNVKESGGVEEEEEDFIRHEANRMFWNYVDSGVMVVWIAGGDGTTWQVKGDDGGKVINVGDHVRLDDSLFYSEVVSIEADGQILKLRHEYTPKAPKDIYPNKEDGQLNEKNAMDIGNNDHHQPHKIHIKRTNRRLTNPHAISITFNLARLHEVAGRTLPSVELHKAILNRHPSYVNSYLRLACIARDCGSLPNCSEWLKSACAVAPGNSEVLCLVGNLHLSLCDWEPAQSIFDQLLQQKVPNVEAYSMLCLGNIYFDNIKKGKKYGKHLEHAAKWYERILVRDSANAYAANGLGTVLAEKGDLPKAKEIFNRVREISGDTIPDALLNLGHIYLALSKHPEALQMYQSYRNRTKDNKSAAVTCKSQDDDDAAVLLYCAFCYFDWARQTELYNDVRAAPADGRYRKCIDYIEMAMDKSAKENILLRYNWCMANLMAANCVLRKLTRGIRRTAQEVSDALMGLQASLPKVQTMIQWKQEKKKVPIPTSTLNMFVANCRDNILNAESHLSTELKKETEAKEQHELQRIENITRQKEKELADLQLRESENRMRMEIDRKARQKQLKVDALRVGWERVKRDGDVKKRDAVKPQAEDDFIDNGQHVVVEEEDIKPEAVDSDSDDGGGGNGVEKVAVETESGLFDSDDDDDDDDDNAVKQTDNSEPAPANSLTKETEQDLFGSSDDDSDESDEELVPSSKRDNNDSKDSNQQPKKKRKILSDDDDTDDDSN